MDTKEFDALCRVLTDERFLSCQLASQELPYYVYAFSPNQQVEMDEDVNLLTSRLETAGVKVLTINLFRLLVDILRENDDLEWFLSDEQEMCEAGTLLETMQGVLDIENDILPAIQSRIEEASPQLLFLTGIGAMYPLLRTHNLLNNLANILSDIPVVTFFPGEFSQSPGAGASFNLFGCSRGEGYYRAFDLKFVMTTL